MVVTVSAYTPFQEELFKGTHDFLNNIYKATLHLAETFVATDAIFNDISAEIGDADYSEKTITSFAITSAALITKLDCDNIVFGTKTTDPRDIAARYIVIRKDIGDSVNDPLCLHIDLGATQTSVNGDWLYTIDPTNGLLRLGLNGF